MRANIPNEFLPHLQMDKRYFKLCLDVRTWYFQHHAQHYWPMKVTQLVSVKLDQCTQNQQEVCSISDQTRIYTTPKMTLEQRTSNGHFPIQALITPCIYSFSLYFILYTL